MAKAHPEGAFETDYGRTFVLGQPGMEHPQSVYDRVSRMREDVDWFFPKENIVFVGHGIVLCMLYGEYHQLSWEEALRKFRIPNGGVHELTDS